MKKTLICGMASLAIVATPVFSAFADEPSSGNAETGYSTHSHDVTVGEVDETVYSVDFSWDDLIFDWKYDEQKNDFGFKPHWECTDDEAGVGGFALYTDDACTAQYTGDLIDTSGLYRKSPSSSIRVYDQSVNGRIMASVSFNPTDKYSWVIGKFADPNETRINFDTETITYGEDIVGGILPAVTTTRNFEADLYFEKDPSATPSSESITTSDKIGTVTLTIEPRTAQATNQFQEQIVSKKNTSLIIIAIVAFVAAIAGGYLLQTINHGDNESDYTITRAEPDGNEETKGDTDVSLQYAGYATLHSDEKLITLNFTNPSRSKKGLSLEIVADINGENITLAKTDIIRPGYKIDSIKYKLNREIPEGTYNGKFVIHFYNEQDKEEIVNSEIKINFYVKQGS